MFAYNNAPSELQEGTLRIQNQCLRIEIQLRVLKDVWKVMGTSCSELQDHHNKLLLVLQEKLQLGVTRLDRIVGSSASEPKKTFEMLETWRLKYALFEKSPLDKIIVSLEEWSRLFDPSWFLIARISRPGIDEQLSDQHASTQYGSVSAMANLRQAHQRSESPPDSIILPVSYDIGSKDCIKYCSPSTFCNMEKAIVINEILVTKQSDLSAIEKDVKCLAVSLSDIDPMQFGLLACAGVIKEQVPSNGDLLGKFDLIFHIPVNLRSTKPISLRSLLLEKSTIGSSLNDRFHLAVSLARSVVFIHSSRFVHKRISPENILLFQSSPAALTMPFLVGFERFRPVEHLSLMVGDIGWERNLYQHPTRQGQLPEEKFSIKHDIYSVGVCLLEIGLWSSFVDYQVDGTPSPGRELQILELLALKDQRQRARKIKIVLIDIAKSRLPQTMGNIYTDAVMACLTCLDRGNNELGDEMVDDIDQITVGVRYIEKILFQMSKIAV
ncbi:hypothetical protein MaudMau93_005063 [Microsporum audouinii]